MDEYISREIAMERIKYKKPKVLYSEYGVGYERGLEDAIGLLNAISAADVQPVKHGKWKYYKNNGIIDTYICTNCQGKVEMTIDVESSKFKYCPNCGARMGGDIE